MLLVYFWSALYLLHLGWLILWIRWGRWYLDHSPGCWSIRRDRNLTPPDWRLSVLLGIVSLPPYLWIVMVGLTNTEPQWTSLRSFMHTISDHSSILSPLAFAAGLVLFLLAIVSQNGSNQIHKRIGDPVNLLFLCVEYSLAGILLSS